MLKLILYLLYSSSGFVSYCVPFHQFLFSVNVVLESLARVLIKGKFNIIYPIKLFIIYQLYQIGFDFLLNSMFQVKWKTTLESSLICTALENGKITSTFQMPDVL